MVEELRIWMLLIENFHDAYKFFYQALFRSCICELWVRGENAETFCLASGSRPQNLRNRRRTMRTPLTLIALDCGREDAKGAVPPGG